MKILVIVLVFLVVLLTVFMAYLMEKIKVLTSALNCEYNGVLDDMAELKEGAMYLQQQNEKLERRVFELEEAKNAFKDLSKIKEFSKSCSKMAEDLEASKTKPDKSLEQALSEIYQTFDALGVCIEEAIIKAYGPEKFELVVKTKPNEIENKRKE